MKMASKRFILDLVDLTKPRICFLSLVMAAWGFLLGSPENFNSVRFTALLIGLGLVGAASGVFNQVAEKDIDGLMKRTLHRPLPAGRVRDQQALFLGFICLMLGEVILVVAVNPLTAILAALTVLSYIGMYTPAKKTTPFSTLIGAIPGALPPLTGFTAATGKFGMLGFWIFALLFLWQVPHFLAIGWVYRDDYRRASLPILSVTDEEGGEVSKQVLTYLLALVPLTLLPVVWRTTSETYLWGAVVLGVVFLASGVFLAWKRTLAGARILFFVSILYLPILGGLMVGTLN
ncbi:MAG: protoheme IX farnesyltransferase [Proteobacteria bacterium]|nr:protoheme IX farnesyltransferase [Pseudomonadota bacterium]